MNVGFSFPNKVSVSVVEQSPITRDHFMCFLESVFFVWC